VGPKTSLDDVEKRKFLTLPGLEFQPLDSPTRSHSLHRLRIWLRLYATSQKAAGSIPDEGIGYFHLT
jgi:hypothetical protein